jgi:hypothetical protein
MRLDPTPRWHGGGGGGGGAKFLHVFAKLLRMQRDDEGWTRWLEHKCPCPLRPLYLYRDKGRLGPSSKP